jgi:hypothetical protein
MTKNHEDIGHKSLFKAISFRLGVHETFEARYHVQDQSRSRAQMRKVSGLRIFPGTPTPADSATYVSRSQPRREGTEESSYS